jgi:hypothetical protein
MKKIAGKSKLQPTGVMPILPWVLKNKKVEEWELKLVGGVIEVSIWNGRISPIVWSWFDGFRCQISGEETIDIEFPNVQVGEAKRLAVEHVIGLVQQLGAELGLWEKRVEMNITGASVIFRGKVKVG